GSLAAAAGLDVAVDAVVGQVGAAADEPLEGGRLPVQDLVPGAEPEEVAGGAVPEALRVLRGLATDALDDRVDEVHRCTPLMTAHCCARMVPVLGGWGV